MYVWVPSFFSLLPASLWAAEPLDLADCFKAALKRSEVLATQQELVIQAEENYHRAWGAILAALNATGALITAQKQARLWAP